MVPGRNARTVYHRFGRFTDLRAPGRSKRRGALWDILNNFGRRPAAGRPWRVHVLREERVEHYSADIVVAACGALSSALLMLRSASDTHPSGPANGSDQVGRNYIRHNMSVVMALKEAARRLRGKLEGLLGPMNAWPVLIDRDLYLGKDIPIGGTAHRAGTMRFGTDPAISLLDLDCRAHELDNPTWVGRVA